MIQVTFYKLEQYGPDYITTKDMRYPPSRGDTVQIDIATHLSTLEVKDVVHHIGEESHTISVYLR